MLRHPLIDRIEFLDETPAGGERVRVGFPHLSGSQLSSLSRCGLAYYFSRKLHLKEPLNSSTLKGSAFHEGIGAFLTLVRDGLDRTEALKQARTIVIDYLASALGWSAEKPQVTEIVDFGHRWPKGPRDTPRTLALDTLAALEHVAGHKFIKDITTLSIERGYVIHWKDSQTLPLVGYTDLVYAHELSTSIHDWKTGAYQKGDYALGMDLAQVGYAFGASADLGVDIDTLSYGTISWAAPAGDNEAADVCFEVQEIPLNPQRIERLYARCVEASRDLRDERFRMGDSESICPTCPFRGPCSQRYGPLDSTTVDSAGFFANRVAIKTSRDTVPAAVTTARVNPNGPSEKQQPWIVQMLQQCELTTTRAMELAGFRPVAHVCDIPKAQASKLIDYLKPLAEKAVQNRDIERRSDRQVAQVRALYAGVSPHVALAVASECGIETVNDISEKNAIRVMSALSRRLADPSLLSVAS